MILKNLDTLLRDTLISLYYDDPQIVYSLRLVDYDKVNFKFKRELFCNIDIEDYKEVDDFLRSEKYQNYQDAINKASLAVTRELADLIEFVVAEQNGGKVN